MGLLYKPNGPGAHDQVIVTNIGDNTSLSQAEAIKIKRQILPKQKAIPVGSESGEALSDSVQVRTILIKFSSFFSLVS